MSTVVKNSIVLVKENTDHRTGRTLNIMRCSKSRGEEDYSVMGEGSNWLAKREENFTLLCTNINYKSIRPQTFICAY